MRDFTSPESHPSRCRSLRVAAALVVALPASSSFAHDIPSSVTVLAFVKPEARPAARLIRVPLEAMRDVNFPVRGPGYLDLAARSAAPARRGKGLDR